MSRDQAVDAPRARRRPCRCTTRVPPGSRIGKHQPARVVLVDHHRAPEVEVVVRASSRSRQSGSGSPSSSISQTRSAPRSTRPAAARRGSRRRHRGSRSSVRRQQRVRLGRRAAGQPLPVPSVEALSTTRISASPGDLASSRATSRCSRPSRLKVTTTATMRERVAARLGHGDHPTSRRRSAGAPRSSAWLAAYPLLSEPSEPPVTASAWRLRLLRLLGRRRRRRRPRPGRSPRRPCRWISVDVRVARC